MRHIAAIRQRSRVLACRSMLSLARRARRRRDMSAWCRHFLSALALSPALVVRDPRGLREAVGAVPGWVTRRLRRLAGRDAAL